MDGIFEQRNRKSALGKFCPAVTIFASITFMAMDGAAGTVTGLDSFVDSKMAKLGIKEGNVAAKELINGLIAWQKACAALDKENYQLKMQWFGSGGYYKVTEGSLDLYGGLSGVSFAGMNNPDTIRNIMTWQDEGIKGWSDADKNGLDKVMETIRTTTTASGSNLYSDQVISDCEKLLYGGYEIINENVKATDMLRFLKAIDAFNDVYNNVPDIKLNVKQEWGNLQ